MPWWIPVLQWVVLPIVLYFVQRALLPRPEGPTPAGLSDFSLPTVDASRVWPVLFGTGKITGPNVLWYGDLGRHPFELNGTEAGYYYFLGLDLAVCHGPVDRVLKVLHEDKDPGFTYLRADGDALVYHQDNTMLFGGNTSGGGIHGNAWVYLGGADQEPDPYLQNWVSADYPGYGGLCHVVLQGWDGADFGGMYLGTSSYIKAIAVVAERCPNGLGLPDGTHHVGDGVLGYDANPAAMLYEILTDATWGLGLAAAKVDTASFLAAGATLHEEGLGISMVVEGATTADDLIAEILRHIDAEFYADPATGLLTLKLIRDDYVVGELPVFDASHVGSVKFSRPSWSETINVARVTYCSRADNWTNRVAQWISDSNFHKRGELAVREAEYRGFATAEAASLAAARLLRAGSYPSATLELEMDRTAWALRPGDCFVLDWPALGIAGMVCRVSRPASGDPTQRYMTIQAVEDMFAVSGTAFSAPSGSGWVDPVADPVAAAAEQLIELPWQLAPETGRVVAALASRGDSQLVGYEVWRDLAGGTAYTQGPTVSGFHGSGELTGEYPEDTDADDATGFEITDLLDVDGLQEPTEDELWHGLALALVDQEIMGWRIIGGSGETRQVAGVVRGLLDTVPATHAAGARVWFLAPGPASEVNGGAGLLADATVAAKLLTLNGRAVLDIGDATRLTVTTANRAARPLPPGKVRVNGVAWPETIESTVDVVVTWAHRHRLEQAEDGLVVSQDADSYVTAPEGGYTIEVRVGGTLKRTVTGISGTTWTYTAAMLAADGGGAGSAVAIRIIPVNGSLSGTYQERSYQVAAPAETVVRTAKGTAYWETQGEQFEFPVANLSVAAGSWLLVCAAFDGGSSVIDSMTLGGVSLAELKLRDFGPGGGLHATLWGAYFASPVSGQTLVINFSTLDDVPSALAITLTEVAGLAATGHPDVNAAANGTSATPSSGYTATPAQAHEYVIGLVATNGPESDTPLAWAGGLTAGQREGASAAVNITLHEGYRIATVQAAQIASGTLVISRAWGAICVTFKAAS